MLQSSYHGVHQVSGVRALSPAHQCGKLQEGDELVQVSYQTVVSDEQTDAVRFEGFLLHTVCFVV